jgi:large subunit ribosomal protein LX
MLSRKKNNMKVFKVIGEIRKPNLETSFKKEVIAIKPEHAVEKVYAELGSKHRVKRFHIEITRVEEVPPDKIENLLLRKIVVGEEEVGKQG